MKNKKFKLLLSLASFMFCIAVLCFGVFSAVQVSYKTTGSINYEVGDVFVKIETNVYHSTQQTLTNANDLNKNVINLVRGNDIENIELHSGVTTEIVETYDPETGIIENVNQSYNVTQNINLEYERYDSSLGTNSNSFTYYLVVTITNYGAEPIHATISDQSSTTNTYSTHTGDVEILGRSVINTYNAQSFVIGLALKSDVLSASGDIDYTILVNTGTLPQQDTNHIVIENDDTLIPKAYISGYSVATFPTTRTNQDNDISYVYQTAYEPSDTINALPINLDTQTLSANTTYAIKIYMHSLTYDPYLKVRLYLNNLPTSYFSLKQTSTILEQGGEDRAVTIYLENTSSSSSVDISNLQTTLKFEPEQSLLKYNNDSGDPYYYVEMGTYTSLNDDVEGIEGQVEYIRWRYLTSDTTNYAAASDPNDITNLSDLTGVYILETYTSTMQIRVSWENSLIYAREVTVTPYYHHTETGLETVPANDYRASNIRKYLNLTNDLGENAYVSKDCSSLNNIYSPSGIQSNLCNDLNIDPENDIVYKQISARSIQDLYKNAANNTTTPTSPTTYYDYTITGPDGSTTIPDTEFDKFWLPSYYEMYNLFTDDEGNKTTNSCPSRVWHTQTGLPMTYWLRSPNTLISPLYFYVWSVSSSGSLSYDNVPSRYLARAAFQIL